MKFQIVLDRAVKQRGRFRAVRGEWQTPCIAVHFLALIQYGVCGQQNVAIIGQKKPENHDTNSHMLGQAGASAVFMTDCRRGRSRETAAMSVSFNVGDLTIHRVIESEGPLFDPLMFFPALTQEVLEENQSWLKPNYIDPASGS